MKNIIKERKGEASMITYMKKRIKLNMNFLCLFEGPTGIGKSWTAISVAENIDPTFDYEKQIVFDFKSCMDLINSDWLKQKKIKIILWDEIQISISNRAWQSKMNRLVNYLLSTFRHQNIILIMTCPYRDFLDSQSMKLIHCIFECSGYDKKTSLSKVVPKFQQYNPIKKKIYPHKLFVITQENKIRELYFWHIKKPNKELIKIYERRKLEFTSMLNKEIVEEINGLSNLKKQSDIEEKGILDTGTIKQRQAKRLFVKHKGNIIKVAEELKIGMPSVYSRLGNKEKLADLRDIALNSLEN